MPFAEKFNKVYEIFTNTLQTSEINLICSRADDFYKPHILETILDKIWESEYIIADVTDSNANVFYELGLAHSIKDIDNVVIVVQDLNFVPFDLKQFRCIVYNDSEKGLSELKSNLEKTFSEASRNSYRINLKENHTVFFEKKIVGRDNNLYNFRIDCPHIGHGLIKIIFHFNEFRIDKPAKNIESEFLFVSEDFPTKKLKSIPWAVSYVETQGNAGRISIDKY